MASLQTMFVVLSFAAAALQSAMAADIVVGDEKGWLPDFNYTSWVQGKQFKVGDNLVFKYKAGAHNVMQVWGVEFEACSASAAAIVFATGNDMVALDAPGKRWYICGVGDHCSRGQKLAVDVLPAAMSPASPPSSQPPPPPLAPSSPPPSSSRSPNLIAARTYHALMAAAAAAMVAAA
ncbi:unnamed protein product [Musa acuminata subsp. malaccensis]|uniref:(wild Malaysian banana) hypothetical protein n=1 Tax=Musa acuminata subsp. malaccensis TaxID=214687 RepID=A0A804J040_MUSAM|nr:PREDICTED: mavicyanin-like [Musa acuminata subsp. malaccensis]CAG1837316.1 unnamed protein product [Musa acuminata subsp. malaccensis]